MVQRINFSIIGPESSGKTTIANSIGEKWGINVVPEYAREYLDNNGPNYDFDDVIQMAIGQKEIEQLSFESNNHTILDTNLYVYKLWFEEAYKRKVEWLDKSIEQAPYHFHFLCYPSKTWQPDPLREHPDFNDRLRFFNWFEQILKSDKRKYTVLEGDIDEMIECANRTIDSFI
jgi:nicotinamide riboside kinase